MEISRGITTKRGRNQNYALLAGELEVGQVWKLQKGPGFGVRLHGIYWLRCQPNTKGGSTTTKVRRLMDAAPLAQKVLKDTV